MKIKGRYELIFIVGILVTTSANKINHNRMFENGQGNLKNESSEEIDATNNWWGGR